MKLVSFLYPFFFVQIFVIASFDSFISILISTKSKIRGLFLLWRYFFCKTFFHFFQVSLSGKLYALGGWRGRHYLKSVEIYDPLIDSWISGPEMSQKRAKHGAATYEDKIYVIGGRSGHRPSELLASAELYQAGQDWSFIPGGMAAIKGPVRVTIVEKPPSLPSFLGGAGTETKIIKMSKKYFVY